MHPKLESYALYGFRANQIKKGGRNITEANLEEMNDLRNKYVTYTQLETQKVVLVQEGKGRAKLCLGFGAFLHFPSTRKVCLRGTILTPRPHQEKMRK